SRKLETEAYHQQRFSQDNNIYQQYRKEKREVLYKFQLQNSNNKQHTEEPDTIQDTSHKQTSGIYCFKGKVVLAEPKILPLLQQLCSNQDDINELQHRTNTISNSNLNLSILQALKTMFDQSNLYVENFCHISTLATEQIKNLLVHIYTNIPGLDQRIHNTPTVSQAPNKIPYRDINIEHEQADPEDNLINYNNLELDDNDSNSRRYRKFVTAMEYYTYQLQIWP
ncbi:33007_t:CDS:2, partial [Racocetra persica]